MKKHPLVKRTWTKEYSSGVQLRCAFEKRGPIISRYTVQLEIKIDENWVPVIRYDNTHGFDHCDTMLPNGTQLKVPVVAANANEAFTRATTLLNASWMEHEDRFRKQVRQ